PAGPRSGGGKAAMLPFAYAKLKSLRDQFDLIYCPGYQGIGTVAIAAARSLGKPVVLRSGNLGVLAGSQWDAPRKRRHVSPQTAPVRWMKRRFTNWYMRADVFVCNNRENEREALACGVPRDRVVYLPNAVDVDRFKPATPGEKDRVRAEAGWPAG